MTEEEFANKIEWEGGIIGALEYGLRAKDLADRNSELYTAWKDLQQIWEGDFWDAKSNVESLLPEDAW